LILKISKCFLDLGECHSEHFDFLSFGGNFLLQMIDFLRLYLILMPGFSEFLFKLSDVEPELLNLLLSSMGIGIDLIHGLILIYLWVKIFD
jgi:hypothetical protein